MVTIYPSAALGLSCRGYWNLKYQLYKQHIDRRTRKDTQQGPVLPDLQQNDGQYCNEFREPEGKRKYRRTSQTVYYQHPDNRGRQDSAQIRDVWRHPLSENDERQKTEQYRES